MLNVKSKSAMFGNAVLALLLLSGCIDNGPMIPQASVEKISIEKAAKELARLTGEKCGCTWSLQKHDQTRSGMYVIGAFPEDGEIQSGFPDEQTLERFIARHRDLFVRPENAVGTWCVTPKGDCHAPGPVTCYLDISVETATLEKAARMATACNQISLAHLKRDGTVEIIDSYQGHHFGDGKPISGPALEQCKKARGE
jgi:hypothetical protein